MKPAGFSARGFDTLHPAMLRLPAPQDAPLPSHAAFFRLFWDEEVRVTDRHGATVERVRLGALAERWWSGAAAAAVPRLRERFAHWPLGGRAHSPPLAAAFGAVRRLLGSNGEPMECVLDRYRHDIIPDYQWAIIGPAGALVSAHRDMLGTASWNLLLSGRKSWRFWPPGASPEGEPCLLFTQAEGDLIWIPENWWHAADYATPCLCLSKNLVLSRSLPDVRAAIPDPGGRLGRTLDAIILSTRGRT